MQIHKKGLKKILYNDNMYYYILQKPKKEIGMSEFSDFLNKKYKEKCKDKKISIRSLANKIGMSHNYLGQILHGKVIAPEGNIQQKLANELIPMNERKDFYDLAAKNRNDIPIDILEKMSKQDKKLDEIRKILKGE